MSNSGSGALCGGCGQAVQGPDSHGGMRLPCPICSSTQRIYQERIHIGVEARISIGFRHKRPGRKRPLAEGFTGWDLRKAVGDFVRKVRHVDRENDRYFEHVETKGGTVLRHCDERLSEHRGHGSAKLKR